MDGWKLVPVVPTAVMVSEGDRRFSFDVDKIYAAMIAAAPTPPNPIACHVNESRGQGGGKVEVQRYSESCDGLEIDADGRYCDYAHVTRLQDEFKEKYQDHKRELQKAWDQRDALKAEVERLKDSIDDSCQMIVQNGKRANVLQSELTKARELLEEAAGILNNIHEPIMLGVKMIAPSVAIESGMAEHLARIESFLISYNQSAPAAKGEGDE